MVLQISIGVTVGTYGEGGCVPHGGQEAERERTQEEAKGMIAPSD